MLLFKRRPTQHQADGAVAPRGIGRELAKFGFSLRISRSKPAPQLMQTLVAFKNKEGKSLAEKSLWKTRSTLRPWKKSSVFGFQKIAGRIYTRFVGSA